MAFDGEQFETRFAQRECEWIKASESCKSWGKIEKMESKEWQEGRKCMRCRSPSTLNAFHPTEADIHLPWESELQGNGTTLLESASTCVIPICERLRHSEIEQVKSSVTTYHLPSQSLYHHQNGSPTRRRCS